jgi:hypothetical protein
VGALLGSGCLGLSLAVVPIAASGASANHRTASEVHTIRPALVSKETAKRFAMVNLAHTMYAHASSSSAKVSGPRPATNRLLPHRSGSTLHNSALPRVTAKSIDIFGGQVKGQHGFDGITALMNGGANSPESIIGGVGDVTPPDQGLAVGASPAGTVLVEFVNDTLDIYSSSGHNLLGAIPAFEVFGLPASSFLSDPRAYWDPSTGHWFLTMFTVGSGNEPAEGECASNPASPNCSTQFIAVSVTSNPFGSYAIYTIDTTDEANTANGCPCFGDYDMVGADANGFYITTNEFPILNGGFNGTVMYAMSKSALIASASSGNPVTIDRYAITYASDPYAAYHLSPSTVTQGSPAPGTEYFVESNANLPNDAVTSGLEVYALLDTASLNTGGTPTLVRTTVGTEQYTETVPNALQKSGPTPLGSSVGFDGTATIDTDFNAVQEVTMASGLLYGELSTGFAYGTQENSGVDWFILRPKAGTTSVSAKMVKQGYVETSQFLLYPDIGVNKSGDGFLTFAVSGEDYWPSAAYVTFSRSTGAGSVVHIASAGVAPLDTFDCYPYFGFSTGQCRYGDYSMAQAYNGQIYMADEDISSQPRDPVANWSTFVYGVPTS